MGKRIGLKDLKSRHAVDRRMIRFTYKTIHWY